VSQPLADVLGRYDLGALAYRRRNPAHTAVATTVVWLCSDATANVNGRTLYVGDDEIAYAQPIGPA